MSTATEILLNHLPDVQEAIMVTGSPTAAYERLKATVPAIATMSLASFRAVAPVIVETAQRLHKVGEPVIQEIDNQVIQEIGNLKDKVAQLTEDLVRAGNLLRIAKHQMDLANAEVAQANQERDAMALELERLKVIQQAVEPVTQCNVEPPKTFEGWTVHTDEKGYTRLHKKVNGKVRGVYIGRQWDAAKARERIKVAG